MADDETPAASHGASSILPSSSKTTGGVQRPLFPRRLLVEYPPAERTADSLGEGEADDLHRYYLKDDRNGRPTRASEWICSRLCEAVGFPAPTPMVLERSNGELVFGSRRIVGVADGVKTQTVLKTATLSNGSPGVPGLTMFLSGVYAFDMFTFNVDRHFGNYLSIDDAGTRRFYAFDFGRGLFFVWPWSGFPDAGQWTRKRGVTARQLHGWDETAAVTTLDRLNAIPVDAVETYMREMPADWLAQTLQDEFLEWWSGTQRQDRVLELRKGIIDGSLL